MLIVTGPVWAAETVVHGQVEASLHVDQAVGVRLLVARESQGRPSGGCNRLIGGHHLHLLDKVLLFGV